ncbi:Flp pilus assembly protein CpaB [Rhodovibrionaceae bacterium A322]
MKKRRVSLVIVAVAVAALAGLLARALTTPAPVAQEAKTEAVEPARDDKPHVLVASRDLAVGSFVTPEDMRWMAWEGEVILSQHLIRGASSKSDIVGSVVRETFTEGQAISWGRIVRPGERGFLAAVLRPDMRAVSVPIDKVTSHSGLILPGDFVDLILTMEVGGREEGLGQRLVSETILQGVRVIAVGQEVESLSRIGSSADDIPNEGTATLEVSAGDAEKVTVASRMGGLSLALLSLSDNHMGTQLAAKSSPTWAADVASSLQAQTAPLDLQLAAKPRGLLLMRGSNSEIVNTQ